jgi:hypothetical protein
MPGSARECQQRLPAPGEIVRGGFERVDVRILRQNEEDHAFPAPESKGSLGAGRQCEPLEGLLEVRQPLNPFPVVEDDEGVTAVEAQAVAELVVEHVSARRPLSEEAARAERRSSGGRHPSSTAAADAVVGPASKSASSTESGTDARPPKSQSQHRPTRSTDAVTARPMLMRAESCRPATIS